MRAGLTKLYYSGSQVGSVFADMDGGQSVLALNSSNYVALKVAGANKLWVNSSMVEVVGNAKLYSDYVYARQVLYISMDTVSSSGVEAVLEQDGAYYGLARSGSLRALKENIRDIPYNGEIHLMRPILYKPKEKSGSRDFVGFIAEEIEEVCPVLASYDNDGSLLGVQYNRICAYLVAEAQQAKRERDDLTNRLKILEESI